jgi:Zn-dependent protease with chaperone function
VDFFARQSESRRTTKYLVLLFFLAFVSVGVVTAIALGLILGFLPDLDTPLLSTTMDGRLDLVHLERFLGIVAVTMVLMIVASMYRSATLSRGGASVAKMLGATEIHSDTTNPAHQRLVNVVEEMSIASGVPVPEIFVLEAEPGINAFAAGLTPADAAVAVTRGALERLNRAELQGVIAHEFSHILNGDMRINQRLVGFSFGILVLSLVGRWMLRSMRFTRRGRGGSAAVVLGLALTAIGAIGVFFSRLIKAAVSRQRELLADASAVQFTREPSALAGALKKIGGYTAALSSTDTEEVAHMLFGTGSASFRGWFATHPPLIERIRALEPEFNPDDFPEADGPLPPHSDIPPDMPVSGISDARASLSNRAVLERTGRIESASVGVWLRQALPAPLYDAAHSHEASLLLVIALVCSSRVDTAMRDERLLEQRLGPQRAEFCTRLRRQLDTLDVRLRLPLLELTIPALKRRPDEQLEFLFDMVRELLARSPRKELFAVVLPRILDAYLAGRVAHRLAARKMHEKLSHPQAADHLLAAVAAFGHTDPAAALAAYRAGLDSLGRATAKPLHRELHIDDESLLDRVDPALDRLATGSARHKRAVLAAVLVTVRHDERIRPEEIELFRAVAAALDCPVPPLVVTAS